VRVLVALVAAATTMLSGDIDRATAMITVATGAHAGDFLVRNADTPCAIVEQKAPRPKHQFEVTIGGPGPKIDPKKLTVLTVIVPNADVRGPIHTFFMSINFGDIIRGTHYITETRVGETPGGSGAVTIVPHEEDATVTFDVTSADGISYKGAIQCIGVSHD